MGRWLVALGMLGVVAGMTLAGPTTTQKCAGAKVKAAGRNVFMTAKCYAKALATGVQVNPDCLASADKKFQAAFAKAEATGACTVVGDVGAIGTAADGCVTTFTDAITGEPKCAAAKTKAIGKDTYAQAKCLQKAFLVGAESVDPECTAKAQTILATAIGKADGYGSCAGDAPTLAVLVGDCVAAVTPTFGPCALQSDGQGGTCGGTCDAGLVCLWDRMNGACACVSPTSDCTQLAPPNCPDPSRLCARPVESCGPIGGGSCGCFGPPTTSTSSSTTSTSSTTTTSTSSTTTTTAPNGSCSLQPDGQGGTCGGSCAGALVCLWDRMNGTCACVTAISDCTQLAPPNCPDPSRLCARPVESCGPMGGGQCGCFGPTTTTSSTSSTTTTSTSSTTTTTLPSGSCALQSDGQGGTCGGACAAGLVCLWDRMNGTCACVTAISDCTQLAPPNCPDPNRLCARPVEDCGPMGGGQCGCFGPTTSSTSSSTTTTSSSTTTTTSTSSTTTTTAPSGCTLQPDAQGGTCGGPCVVGLVCLWDPMNGTCACESPTSDCTQLAPPNCPDPSRHCARPNEHCGSIGGGQCGCQ